MFVSPNRRLCQILGFLAFLLFLAGCSAGVAASDDAVGEPTSPTTSSSTSTTTTTTSTTTTTTVPSLAPPLETDGVPRVARTSTDVVVPVLSETNGGYLVRTPCQNTAIVLDAEVDDRVHVVLDPGHGGSSEPGAVSFDGITEAEVNFEVALQTEALLAEQGFDVTLTRYSDVRVPLATRVEIADRLEASLLVSIHHQGTDPLPTSDQPGTEVFYQQTSNESRRFAGILVEESRAELGVFNIDWFTGPDAGAVIRPNAETGLDFYGMIRLPETTAVLAEMAFLGNEAEVALLRSGELQTAEAIAISNAIIRWFTTDDPGSGFVEPSFGLRSSGGGGGTGGCVDPDLGETLDLASELSDSLGLGEDSEDEAEG